MNGFALTAALVESLAWPVAVLAIAFMLRKQLAALLELPIRRMKLGMLEVETWDRTVDSEVPDDFRDVAMPDGRVQRQLAKATEEHPSLAVLQGFLEVEQALVLKVLPRMRELVDDGELEATGNSPNAQLQPVRFARLAAEYGALSHEAAEAIAGLSTLRNLSAHAPSGQQVDTARAVEYLAMVDAVLYAIDHPPRPS